MDKIKQCNTNIPDFICIYLITECLDKEFNENT